MCPPAPVPAPADIGKCWTDEDIFTSLKKFKSGSPLPSNVTSDVNPYQYLPSNLPEEMWYFCSGMKKDSKHGFWMATGEPHAIFFDSDITGWRTTFEFYEGQARNGQRTNWVMQEYTITVKELCHNSKPKDSRALCRIFFADAKCRGHELLSNNDLTNIADVNSFCLMPTTFSNANSSTGQISKSDLLERNMDNVTGPSDVAKRSPDPPIENIPESDHFLGGDYLELDDLADPELRSSSSDSSIMSSEAYFDSMDFLRELKDDKDQQNANCKFNLSASVKSKEVVMCPASVESLRSGKGCNSPPEGTPKFDSPVRKQQCDYGNGSASNSHNRGEKKGHVGRMKRLKMKYFCFMSF